MLKFKKNLIITSVIGALFVTSILGYLYRKGEISNIVEHSETRNTTLVHLFYNSTWDEFSTYFKELSKLNANELKHHAGLFEFGKAIRAQYKGLNIHLANVLSLEGTVLFSTNSRNLGNKRNLHKNFQSSKSGKPASMLIYRDIVNSLEDLMLDRYVVESFVPILDANNKTIAIFELHSDVTAAIRALDKKTHLAITIIGALFILLIVILYVISSKADLNVRKLLRTVDQQEKLIKHQGYYDMLTGLPNRVLLQDRLLQAMQISQDREQLLALLFIDLDHFQKINDALGYSTGDHLLLEVSDRLKQCIRGGDTIARIGGDEFIVLLKGLSVIDEAEEIARHIGNAMTEAFTIDGNELFISASVGIVAYPFEDDDLNSLLKKANSAMCKAKKAGRNTYQYYAEHTRQKLASRFSIENALRRALERDEFELYYQPVVQARTGNILAVEALLRWNSSDLGFTSPLKFIPLLEETGLIIPVGQWVLENASAQCVQWQQQGINDLRISINMSAKQLLHKGLIKHVNGALTGSGLKPHFLDLEITESVLIDDFGRTIQILDDLNEIGISLSVDDFGTGYSSLSYLKQMPVETIKIDQSFIRDISTNVEDAAIVDAICALSRSLRFKVIAEGVESAHQLDLLHRANVNAMQGYFFSRPLSVSDIEPVLRQGSLLNSDDPAA
ncbi:putative bifunctional diguanylate cyclase/phosphodiesterase [Kaarinaea lacus]